MADKPKIFGELGLGTNQLKQDIEKAKSYIQELAKEAETLGKLFNSLGVKTNLKNISDDLNNMSQDIKKANDKIKNDSDNITKAIGDNTKKIKQKTEEMAKEITTANQKVVEAIAHNWKIGIISPEEAAQQLQNYIKTLRGEVEKINILNEQGKNKALKENLNFEPTSTDKYTSEIVKAESFLEDIRRSMEKAETAFNNLIGKNGFAKYKEEIDRTFKDIKHSLDMGEISPENAVKKLQDYVNSLRFQLQNIDSLDFLSKDNGKYTDKTTAFLKNEIIKAENLITSTNKLIQKEQEDATKNTEKENELRLESLRKELLRELDLEKDRYSKGLTDYKEFIEKINSIEKQGTSQSLFNEDDLVKIQKYKNTVQQNINKLNYNENILAEKAYVEESKRLVNEVFNLKRTGRVTDLNDYKRYLQDLLNSEKISVNDRIRVEKELYKTNETLRKNDLAEVQKAVNKLSLGSESQKFQSLSNYAFDASLIYGTIQGVQNIVSNFREIEKQSTELARVMPSASKQTIKELRDSAFEMASYTAQNVVDVQKIQNLWARTSDEIANNKDALDYLTKITSIGMNVGGFTDAEEAVRLLNAAIQQMGLSWKDAGKIMDSWIKTADTTSAGTAKDLADALMRVGSQAKMLGLDYNDLNAITGLLANSMAKSGEDIGTAMKTVFAYFQDDKTIETLDKWGVHVKKNEKEYNNFIDIMNQLQQTYAKLKIDNNQQAIHEIDEALGRIRRVDYVGALIDQWGQYKDLVQSSMDSTGYAIKQNEKVMDTFDAKIKQLNVEFQKMSVAIGESGLLDGLKGLTIGLTSAIEWFNKLDPTTKSFITTFMEFSAVILMVNKSFNLLLGTGLTQTIANLIGRVAILTQNQTLANLAVQSGVQFINAQTGEVIANTSALFGNTGAKTANSVAQEANNVAEQQGVATSIEQTTAEGAETVSINTNTGALIENTTAQTANNTVKVASASTAGILAGAIGALSNPITLVTVALGVAVGGFMAYKNAQQQARQEAEKMKDAQESLNQMMSKSVIDESEIPQYNDKINQLQDLNEKLINAKKKLAQAQAEYDKEKNNAINNSVGTSVGTLNIGSEQLDKVLKYNKEIQDLDKKLRELGSSSKTVKDDIKKLDDIVTTSSNSQSRKVATLIELIKKQQDQNNTIREQVAEYERLKASITSSSDVTERFKELTNILLKQFPAEAMGINKVTQQMDINTQAIKQNIGSMGQLSKQQLIEIEQVAMLDESTKKSAENYLKAQIEMTKSAQINTSQRIKMYLAEAQAIEKMINSNQIQFGTREYADAEKRYRRMMNDPEMKQWQTNLTDLEEALKIVENLKPFNASSYVTPSVKDLESSNKESKSNSDEIYYPTIDRYMQLNDVLTKINTKISDTETLMDKLNDNDKIPLLQQEITLLRQKQEALHQINDERRKETAELKNSLSKYGFTFSGDVIYNYSTQLKKYSGDTAKNIEDMIKRYEELVYNLMPEASSQWGEVESKVSSIKNQITEINNQIIEQRNQLVQEQIDIVKSVESELMEIVKNRIQEEYDAEKKKIQEVTQAQEDSHNKRMQQLEDERKKAEDVINAMIKQIDSEESEYDFNRQLSDLEKQRQDLQEQFNKYSLDDSDEGKARALEVKKELDDKDKEIDDLKHKRQVDLRKQNLQDQLEMLQDEYNNKVNAENKEYELEKQMQDKKLQDLEDYYNKRLEKDNLYQEVYKLMITKTFDELSNMIVDFENKFGDGMSIAGQSIKDNLINNLRIALDLMQQIGYSGGGNFDTLLKGNINNDDYVDYLIRQQEINWGIAKANNDIEGMTEAHNKANEIREAYGRPTSVDGSADTKHIEWLKKMGIASLDTGGMLNFASEEGKLILAHRNEVIFNPIQTKELLASSLMLRTSIPYLKDLISNIKLQNPNKTASFHFDNLIKIDGDVASDKLNNVKEFAKETYELMYSELKAKGVL